MKASLRVQPGVQEELTEISINAVEQTKMLMEKADETGRD